MSDHLPMLEHEISALLAPAAGPLPARRVVEDTLTTGSAHALRLEGERLRAEDRLRDLIRSGRNHPRDLDEVTGELARVEVDLQRLRALLATLRARL